MDELDAYFLSIPLGISISYCNGVFKIYNVQAGKMILLDWLYTVEAVNKKLLFIRNLYDRCVRNYSPEFKDTTEGLAYFNAEVMK